MPALIRSIAFVSLIAAALQSAGCAGSQPVGAPPDVSDADRDRFARRRLEDSRALVQEGRLGAAERNLRRGLEVRPDDPALHRALARVLDTIDRPDEARSHRAIADEIDPPEPLPEGAAVEASQGILVALLPPLPAAEHGARVPNDWPDGPAAQTLRKRIRIRLPGATAVHLDPQTVAEARRALTLYSPRAVLSLRVDRSFCGESRKDGPFSVAWLRAAAETPGDRPQPAKLVRRVVSDPSPPDTCIEQAMARAFESALSDTDVRRTADAVRLTRVDPPISHASLWTRATIRSLFPGIGMRVAEHIAEGRAFLANGQIANASEAFQRALHADPEDPYARAYLAEAESTLAMVRELSTAPDSNTRWRHDGEGQLLDPRISPAQVAAAEARLAEEKRRRTDLLAALAVLDEDVEMPSERLRQSLREVQVRDPDAFGPALARSRAGGTIHARAAYAPDGAILARYYYAEDNDVPLVREEDTNGDGNADRWIGYAGTRRAEVWEDGHGSGRPDIHFVFAAGGTPLRQIEIDADLDGNQERVFHYDHGQLRGEDRDTDGDGALDRFDKLDATGQVIERGDDIDGDGDVDVRHVYRDGKLIRRQFNDAQFAPGPSAPPEP